MKKDGFFTLRVYPILFMAAATIVCISIISGIYLATENLTKSNETLFIKRAVLASAGIAVPESGSEAIRLYDARVREVKDKSGTILSYEILGGGGSVPAAGTTPGDSGIVSFSIIQTGPGLWGNISAVIGFRKDFSAMTGIEFIEQSETPGLGARIAEPWFKEQFRGKMGPFTVVPEGTSLRPDEMDGITGATRTSDFVRQIINDGIERARTLAAQGGGNE